MIPTSPAMTPVSPHGAAGQQKQPLPPLAVTGGRPSPEPSFTSLQQTLTARPWSAHQAREQSLSVGECDRVVDITPLTVWPLTFMLAHKAVPHGCRHLLFTTMCSTIPTSPTMTTVSPHGAAGQQTPPLPPRLGFKNGVVARYAFTSHVPGLASRCGWTAKTNPPFPQTPLSPPPPPDSVRNRFVIR